MTDWDWERERTPTSVAPQAHTSRQHTHMQSKHTPTQTHTHTHKMIRTHSTLHQLHVLWIFILWHTDVIVPPQPMLLLSPRHYSPKPAEMRPLKRQPAWNACLPPVDNNIAVVSYCIHFCPWYATDPFPFCESPDHLHETTVSCGQNKDGAVNHRSSWHTTGILMTGIRQMMDCRYWCITYNIITQPDTLTSLDPFGFFNHYQQWAILWDLHIFAICISSKAHETMYSYFPFVLHLLYTYYCRYFMGYHENDWYRPLQMKHFNTRYANTR